MYAYHNVDMYMNTNMYRHLLIKHIVIDLRVNNNFFCSSYNKSYLLCYQQVICLSLNKFLASIKLLRFFLI